MYVCFNIDDSLPPPHTHTPLDLNALKEWTDPVVDSLIALPEAPPTLAALVEALSQARRQGGEERLGRF